VAEIDKSIAEIEAGEFDPPMLLAAADLPEHVSLRA
jgi:hypothetical protein